MRSGSIPEHLVDQIQMCFVELNFFGVLKDFMTRWHQLSTAELQANAVFSLMFSLCAIVTFSQLIVLPLLAWLCASRGT